MVYASIIPDNNEKMADLRKIRYTMDEVLRYFLNDDNSSCDSSSEELDFKEFIGLAVDSEASSEEDCTQLRSHRWKMSQ